MNKRLQGKTALITAAAQGIGRATAEFYVQQGATVFATDIRDDLLADFTGGTVYKLDVTNKNAIVTLSEKIPSLDILVNCAGVVPGGSILDCDEDQFDFAVNLNMRSMYLMIKTFLPGMLANGGGSIINVASMASSIKGVPNRFSYGTTKAGVIGLTKAVAADFVAQGIRCNAICPGTVDSPSLHDRLRHMGGTYEDNLTDFIARQPIGRLGTAEEVAHLAVYLGADESAYTTGRSHIIDGGWVM